MSSSASRYVFGTSTPWKSMSSVSGSGKVRYGCGWSRPFSLEDLERQRDAVGARCACQLLEEPLVVRRDEIIQRLAHLRYEAR